MISKRIHIIILFLGAVAVLSGCHDEPPAGQDDYGKIRIVFSHKINDEPLLTDTLAYTNAAGNRYLVTEVQYFISDVMLYRSDGSTLMIDDWKDLHYVDNDLPSTMTWEVYDKIPTGGFDSLAFIFGIPEEKNQSFMYTDPPESLMFWPEFLGGGYHYLKLNGKWLDTLSQLSPFDFHMGIGQYYDGQGNITGFIQNYFRVSLPGSAFQVTKDKTMTITLTMNIESWFETPHVYDHNQWGGAIMQTQAAMQLAKENGHDVFTASIIVEY